jgi:hypothetical protein
MKCMGCNKIEVQEPAVLCPDCLRIWLYNRKHCRRCSVRLSFWAVVHGLRLCEHCEKTETDP